MNSVENHSLSFFNRLQVLALLIGVVGVALAVAGWLVLGFNQFIQSYLVAFIYWIGISLGSLAVLMMHFAGGGRWGGSIRRILEAASKTIWLTALLFIPIVLGMGSLYIWNNHAAVAANPLLQYKSAFLNPGFFILSAVVIFIIWFIMIYLFSRWSAQEEAGDMNARRREARLAAGGLILYFLTMTVAAYYWIVSIFPTWTSSVFGLLIIISQALAGMAFALVILLRMPGFRPGEVDPRSLKKQLLRDLGALELTLVILWAYLFYFQFLIIWAGNIPHETDFYITRISNGWAPVVVLIVLVQFALPFVALIPMWVRSRLSLLSVIGLIILAISWVHYYWTIIPAFYPAFHLSWLDIVLPLAMGGWWVAAFVFHLKRRSLQPYWDMPMETEHAPEVQQ